MNRGTVDDYLRDGCGRCEHYQTPACKVLPWAPAIRLLRATLLEAGLAEGLKWGNPCYTLGAANVVLIGPLKESLTLGFFRGTELPPEAGQLEAPGPNSQRTRVLRFRTVSEVEARLPEVRRCIALARDLEATGSRPAPAAPVPLELPAELAERLAADQALRAAFEALTPGRQRSHALHVSGAAQSATRARRVERCVPIILAGRGFLDR